MSLPAAFRHEAYLYEGIDDFLAGAAPFLEEGIESGEPMLIAVDPEKAEVVRGVVGAVRSRVSYVDMAEVGRNPARILPVWLDFVSAADGSTCRGIGEPLWPGRTDAERAECHRHERLLNLAFCDTRGFRLMCPYDKSGLDPSDLECSRRTHPTIASSKGRIRSPVYQEPVDATVFDAPLGDVPVDASSMLVEEVTELAALRTQVADHACRVRLSDARARDAAIAVNEIVANSLRHGGGKAEIRLWESEGALVCEVRDRGHISNALAGRIPPGPEMGDRGMGLWLVNQICDLVELRTSPSAGTAVRLHLSTTNTR